MKKKTLVVSLILVVLLSSIVWGPALKALLYPVHTATKSIDMAYEVSDKLLTGEKAIQEYEWFKQQEEDISALYRKEETAIAEIDTFKDMFGDPKEWTMFQQNDYSRLSSNLTGIRNMTDNAMATYNARSKMTSRNIFKDNLPVTISRAFYARRQMVTGGN
ncbi:MAG: hypothetical protein GY804_02720 [Alphaproteobacteria bacterium]|nr:hypothetical protein [Alphaproteobacteria bacterium]